VQTSDPPKDPPGESPGEKAHIAVAGESSVADASLEKPTEGAPRKGATPEEVAARIVVATDQEPVKATTTTTTTVGRRREDDQWQLQQKEKQEEQEMVVADSEWDGGRLWIELAVYTSARRARTSDLFKEIGRGKAAKGLTLSMVRDFVASTLAPCNGFVFLGAARGDDDDSLARTFRAAMEMTNPGRGGGGEGAQEEEMERELSLGQLKQELARATRDLSAMRGGGGGGESQRQARKKTGSLSPARSPLKARSMSPPLTKSRSYGHGSCGNIAAAATEEPADTPIGIRI